MSDWTAKNREDIVKRLHDKGVSRPCPRCGGEQFSLVDGYAVFGLVDKLEDEQVRNLIPSVCVACNSCGYLTFHALGPLGMMPDQPGQPKQDKQTVESGEPQKKETEPAASAKEATKETPEETPEEKTTDDKQPD